ncbi:MAG: riboflavin synthase [Firmicutes bacterium]|nr:riboflavin synthase [Bacillota bacterium]
MFTGIVEELGEILNQQRKGNNISLVIRGSLVLDDLKVGDSIAVNGVCLTVTDVDTTAFYADVMPETLRKTGLYELKKGDKVNLERALPANGRFGGHFVSGHVDGTGTILTEKKEGNAQVLRISASREIIRYLIEKGSIAVDGVSLTAYNVSKNYFDISLIPHTTKVTTLGFKKPGDKVNLEADMLGKYVEKFFLESADKNLFPSKGDKGLTYTLLKNKGFI